MALKIIIRPLAQEDLDDAITWYNKQRDNLGQNFYLEFVAAIKVVSEHPFSFRKRHKQARAFHLKRFPYRIYYVATYHEIHVIAVIHQKRSSKVLKGRTRKN